VQQSFHNRETCSSETSDDVISRKTELYAHTVGCTTKKRPKTYMEIESEVQTELFSNYCTAQVSFQQTSSHSVYVTVRQTERQRPAESLKSSFLLQRDGNFSRVLTGRVVAR
jgi:hypothetical protein